MVERGPILTAGERAWLDRLIAPLPRSSTILDLGCGGGEPIDRYLIDHGFHIVGVDHSPTMIELAHTRFPRERWLLGDLRSITFDESFAGAIAWNSLPPPADADAMAERLMGWLQAGGRLLFNGDADIAPLAAALHRRGMVEMAHVARDPACDGADIWLFRKP
jgi:SAM-dependent methyltransferase